MLRILCAVALVLLAFAHKPVAIQLPPLQIASQSGSDSEALFIRYETMPDGSVVSICISTKSTKSDHHHNNHMMMVDCEACRISSSFVLVAPPATGGPITRVQVKTGMKRMAPDLPRTNLYPPSAPPQAPPLLA